MKILRFLDNILKNLSIGFIKIYQFLFSPDKGLPSPWLKGKICAHHPHCSEYAIQVFKRYGFTKGYLKAMERVSQCQPSSKINYDPSHYKVVFFSNAPIGVNYLKELVNDDRFEVVGVVTSPDKPMGRGHKIKENIIKSTAKELDIKNILTPEKINPNKSQEGKDFFEEIKSLEADFFVVISYGKIIPKEVLDIPTIDPINIHGSLLPKYRGASPIQSVFLNNDEKTGITLMKMSHEMDAGDIIKKLEFKVTFEWTTKEVIDKFSNDGPKFMVDNLWDYGKGHIQAKPQDENQVVYCGKIEKQQGEINIFNDSLEIVYQKYRAFYLWPGIYFVLDENFGKNNGKTVKIEKLVLNQENYESHKNNPIITDKEKITLNPDIEEIQVKPQNKQQISWEDFLKGYFI